MGVPWCLASRHAEGWFHNPASDDVCYCDSRDEGRRKHPLPKQWKREAHATERGGLPSYIREKSQGTRMPCAGEAGACARGNTHVGRLPMATISRLTSALSSAFVLSPYVQWRLCLSNHVCGDFLRHCVSRTLCRPQRTINQRLIIIIHSLQHPSTHLCYDSVTHASRDRAPGKEEMEWTLSPSWIRRSRCCVSGAA